MKTWLVVSSCALVLAAGSANAVVYSYQLDLTKYGRENQTNVSMPHSVTNVLGGGANSCVPTSIANSHNYLQQAFPATYGTSLVPTTVNAAAIDIGRNFTSTKSDIGTTGANWISGRQAYVEAKMPGVSTYGSTFNNFTGFMNAWFPLGAAMEVGILPTAGGIGHALTLTGYQWNDANNDGIVQQAENATMKLIDPGAPVGEINLPFWQVGATFNATYSATAYNVALMTATIPVPGTAAVLGLAGVFAFRRRRA